MGWCQLRLQFQVRWDSHLIDAVMSRLRVLNSKFKDQVEIVLHKVKDVIPDIYAQDSPLINIEYDGAQEIMSSTGVTVDFEQGKKRRLT